ncbi:hypothetical protein TNCV_2318291 [Trichonephila clavipes]|nr:hypothetical protein TNCV_2318291 [Trichonephila clavipes]
MPDRTAGRCASRHVWWSSALRLNWDSSLKMTRLQSVTLQAAEVGKNPVDTAYDVGSVVSVLADVGSSPTFSRLLMVSLDGTGCLEGGSTICPTQSLCKSSSGTTQNAGFEQESSGLGAGPPVAGLSAAGRNARAGLRTPLPGAPGIHWKLSLQTGTVR